MACGKAKGLYLIADLTMRVHASHGFAMHKRAFLAAASLSGLLPATTATAAATRAIGPALLTLTGAITRTNRGPLDPALDQMMVKHGIAFTKAYQFDANALHRLPAVTIHPTLEYDA
jgi:uncharacterized protein (DUF2342 family)